MWDDRKRKRFNELREPDRQLDKSEQHELASLVKDLAEMESAFLPPSPERIRQERIAIEQCNARLEKIIERKKALAAAIVAEP